MYEGELKKGMVAKLRRGTKVSYVRSNGKQHTYIVQFEASKWIIENTDIYALVLRITNLWHIGINVFRHNLLTLHDANGTQIYPEPKKAPEWKVGDLVSDAENDCGPCKIIAVRRRTETVLLACSLCDSEWERDFCALNPYEPPVDELVECLNQTSGERWDEQARDVIEQFIIIPRNQGD